jgi:hypothetical protein
VRAERLGEREAASERVAVGVLVPEDQDLLVRLDQVLDLVVEVRFVPLRAGYCSESSARSGS